MIIVKMIPLHLTTRVIWVSTSSVCSDEHFGQAVVLSYSALLTPRQNSKATEAAVAHNSVP